jgi:hypothetical protein
VQLRLKLLKKLSLLLPLRLLLLLLRLQTLLRLPSNPYFGFQKKALPSWKGLFFAPQANTREFLIANKLK